MQSIPSRSILSLVALAVTGLSSSAVLAQTEVAPSVVPASVGKMRLSFGVLPAPFGKLESNLEGMGSSTDAALTYGLRAAFDCSVNRYFFVGFGPQVLFDVNAQHPPKGSDAGKQFDLSARLGGHAPIADDVHLYGFLSPGYSILVFPRGDGSFKGLSLGAAIGALFSVPGTDFFLNAELGYHRAFLTLSRADLETSYLLVALGGGIKL